MKGFTYTLREGGEMFFPGADFGPKNPTLMAAEGDYIVYKIHGYNARMGLGERGHEPTRWVLAKVEPAGDSKFKIVDELREITPGHFWRRAKTKLIDDMIHMSIHHRMWCEQPEEN